jgi:hypothetical protein
MKTIQQILRAFTFLVAGLAAVPALAQNQGWMYAVVPDGTFLSDLTIPGTHDSGAMVDAPSPETGTANAQTMSIPDQLNAGVRFLDIRLNFSPAHALPTTDPLHDDNLYVYHGLIPQLISGDTVFAWLSQFLSANRGEMVFVSIKNEVQAAKGAVNDNDFQTALEKLLLKYDNRILSTTSVPQYSSNLLDTHRIVLVRRYKLPHASAAGVPSAIDATQGWPSGDHAHAVADLPGGQLAVEDRYDFVCSGSLWCSLGNAEEQAMLAEKRDALFSLVDEALVTEGDFDGTHKLRISFASASLHPSSQPLPTPGVIPFFSNYVNEQLQSHSKAYRGRAGAVLIDRAAPEPAGSLGLIGSLVNMNRLRPYEGGPASTSGGTARINPSEGKFCSSAARGVCFTLPSGVRVSLGGVAVGRPAMALGANNNETSVFVVGTDHALYTRWQTAPSSNPAAFNPSWVSLGGYLTSDPAALRNCSGVMEVFARGGNGEIYTTWQKAPGGSWNVWASLGGIARSRPTLSANGCTVSVSVIGADGRTWTKTRSNWVWGSWLPQ